MMAKSEEELKRLLVRVKETSEKSGLKFNIQKIKNMASSPITSWQIDVETMETVTDFFSWAPKSLQMVTTTTKLKTPAPWKESYDEHRQHIKNQRHYFANKGLSSFSLVVHGCESWIIKKAEQWRIDAFELWCWRRLLRVPSTARGSD